MNNPTAALRQALSSYLLANGGDEANDNGFDSASFVDWVVVSLFRARDLDALIHWYVQRLDVLRIRQAPKTEPCNELPSETKRPEELAHRAVDSCSHPGAKGPCMPRSGDGRCIWCEREMLTRREPRQ